MISFVLERKTGSDSSSDGGNVHGSRLGIFSIALVMCVCCINSFFTPVGISGSASDSGSQKSVTGSTYGVTGQSLLTVENSEPSSPDGNVQLTQSQANTALAILQTLTYILCTWTTLFKFFFLVFFAVMILTFPWGDDVKQWAARKPWLRKTFGALLSDVPLQASKNIKNL